MASELTPYLNFDGNAREAMEFYASVFGGELAIQTFAAMRGADSPDADRTVHARLETEAGYTIMASDIPSEMEFQPIAGITVSLSGDDRDALRGYWDRLSADGTVTMALNTAAWGDEFGMCVDQFGVPWMVNISAG